MQNKFEIKLKGFEMEDDRINVAGIPASEVIGKEKTEEDKLRDQIQEQEYKIKALKGIITQLIPITEVLLPHLKKIDVIDKDLLQQVEKVIQIAKIMSTTDEELPKCLIQSL